MSSSMVEAGPATSSVSAESKMPRPRNRRGLVQLPEAKASLEPVDISVAIDPPLRDIRDVMEWPGLLALKNGRTPTIRYDDGRICIEVFAPKDIGIATIWDWDTIIGVTSLMRNMLEAGLFVSRRIEFTPSALLAVIGRGNGGKDYSALANSIRRLRMTTVVTDIRAADGAGMERPFCWITNYAIPTTKRGVMTTPGEHRRDVSGAHPWIIELHPWLYAAIERGINLLAIHPDYWRLGAIERALYRLARKSVPERNAGLGEAWRWTIKTLHRRLCIRRSLAAFAADVRKIAKADRLPEYRLEIERSDIAEAVVITRAHDKSTRRPVSRRISRTEDACE